MKINLKALSEKELRTLIESHGESPYRAKQIINWIYKKQATSIEQMTDLPKDLRKELQKTTYISNLKLQKEETSRDGTRKFLFELEDKETIESVLIPDKDRLTLCISSQVGCAMGCKFCITGRIKLKRNLRAYEIVDQIIAVQRLLKNRQRISNVVFMGMGEPLHNFSEVCKALRRITDLLGFSKRKVTLSTVGIPPKILELAKNDYGINLAVSLNATTDEIRNKIMPINKRYPLKELINACKRFPLGPYRQITFEYVLLDGINSSREDALRLVRLLRGIKAKVNLIPYNEISAGPKAFDKPFRRPPENKILMFQKTLLNAGVRAILRKSKGTDISAACGQLRAGYLVRNQTS
jgi:23S rRNA (adenine2503-C2)-methyltransferase